jgi:hypothetical protein
VSRQLFVILCLVLVIPCCFARLGETVTEIEVRYGKPLKGVKPECPATVAGVYAKPGFQIVVGFRQGKSYYEKIHKLDPQNPKALAEISNDEQEILLKANCSGCNWTGQVTRAVGLLGETALHHHDLGPLRRSGEGRLRQPHESADHPVAGSREGRRGKPEADGAGGCPEGAGEPEGVLMTGSEGAASVAHYEDPRQSDEDGGAANGRRIFNKG